MSSAPLRAIPRQPPSDQTELVPPGAKRCARKIIVPVLIQNVVFWGSHFYIFRMERDARQLPMRTRPAHFPPVESGNRSIILFVTVCTFRKRPLLANRQAHDLLVNVWKAADLWSVGRYVIMPDHIHLFCAPNRIPAGEFGRWMEYWKSRVAAEWNGENVEKLWQRDWWDTQLRQGESFSEKWEYVRENPVRAGLVNTAEDWPFQGEIHHLMWHDVR